MKRYFKEVKELSPREFVVFLYGNDFDWAEIQAGYRIYKEDGGDLSWEEWLVNFPEYNPPVEDVDWIKGKNNKKEVV